MRVSFNTQHSRTAPVNQQTGTDRRVESIPCDWQKSGREALNSPFNRSQQSRWDEINADSSARDAGDNLRLKEEEQKQSSRFQELMDGRAYETAAAQDFSRNPSVEILDAGDAQNQNNSGSPLDPSVDRTLNWDPVFGDRNRIDDAQISPQFSPQSAIPQNDLRETFFRSVDDPANFISYRKIDENNFTSPVAPSREPPETRATLLNILHAQGPGNYLHLFA